MTLSYRLTEGRLIRYCMSDIIPIDDFLVEQAVIGAYVWRFPVHLYFISESIRGNIIGEISPVRRPPKNVLSDNFDHSSGSHTASSSTASSSLYYFHSKSAQLSKPKFGIAGGSGVYSSTLENFSSSSLLPYS